MIVNQTQAVHQGMSPVFNGDAEDSDNMELGFRYDGTALEVMDFSSDDANLVAVSNGWCDPGDTFDGGKLMFLA